MSQKVNQNKKKSNEEDVILKSRTLSISEAMFELCDMYLWYQTDIYH